MRKNPFLTILLVFFCFFFLLAGSFSFCFPAWQAGKEQAQQEELLLQIRRKAEKNRCSIPKVTKTGSRKQVVLDDASYSLENIDMDDGRKSEKRQQWQEAYPDVEEGEGIGILEIPAIQAELPVVAGASKEQLKQSEGWAMQSDPVGSLGNAVIAGHRSYEYGRHFNRLEELVPGDRILFQRADGVKMQFLVNEALVVEPDDTAVFARPEKSVAQLTLYTCTPVRKATHRLVVRAQRIK